MGEYKVLKHNSIRIDDGVVIYIDPFQIDSEIKNDADYIFITHSHYDHLSIEDIRKIINKNTVIITPHSGEKDLKESFSDNDIVVVEPNKEYKLKDVSIKTTYAYNYYKDFHPKENMWVGYLILLNNIIYYIAGDTDFVKELENIVCDVAFLPVGGKYTMDSQEAAQMANKIEANIIVPTHYGSIVGNIKDAQNLYKNVKTKKVEIHIK